MYGYYQPNNLDDTCGKAKFIWWNQQYKSPQLWQREKFQFSDSSMYFTEKLIAKIVEGAF